MKFVLIAALAQLVTLSAALPKGPSSLRPRAGDRGNQTVDGLGERKQAVLGVGGNSMDLAIAMLET